MSLQQSLGENYRGDVDVGLCLTRFYSVDAVANAGRRFLERCVSQARASVRRPTDAQAIGAAEEER